MSDERRAAYVAGGVTILVAIGLAVLAWLTRSGLAPGMTWFDGGFILGIAVLFAALVIVLAIDTDHWRVAGAGFVMVAAAIAIIYARVKAQIRGIDLLQSDEVQWEIRLLLAAGGLLVFGAIIHRLITQKRDRMQVLKRLGVLALACGVLWGAAAAVHAWRT